MTSLCVYCLQEGRSVPVEYALEAGTTLCPECGSLDPTADSYAAYETIGRATEDESHLLGRALVNQTGRVVGSGTRGRMAAQAAKQARADTGGQHVQLLLESAGATRIIDSIIQYCALAVQRQQAERATALFKAAIYNFPPSKLNVQARAWAAAAVWMAADESALSTNTHELLLHFRVRFQPVRKCKMRLRSFSGVQWSEGDAGQLTNEAAALVLDSITELCSAPSQAPRPSTSALQIEDGDNDDDADDEAQFVPPISPKNKPFLKAALPKLPLVSKFAHTLASRFTADHFSSIQSQMVHTAACFMIALEAIVRRPVPVPANLSDCLAPKTCFGAPGTRLVSKYRHIGRWLQHTFLRLPWVPQEQKRPFEFGDEDQAWSRGQHAGSTYTNTNASGTRKKADLVRFFQEIIDFDPAVFGESSLPLDGDDEHVEEPAKPLLEAPAPFEPKAAALIKARSVEPPALPTGLVDLRSFSYRQPPPHLRKRAEFISRAEQALVTASDDVEHLHSANTQQYLRLLLSGEDASELVVSSDPRHVPIEPVSSSRQRSNAEVSAHQRQVARLLLERHCSIDELDLDTEAFYPGELDSYLRPPEEVELAKRVTSATGAFDSSEKQKEKQAAVEARDKRRRLREAERAHLEKVAAGPGRISQKRKRAGNDNQEEEEARQDEEEEEQRYAPTRKRGDRDGSNRWVEDIFGPTPDFDTIVQSMSSAPYAAKFADDQASNASQEIDLIDLDLDFDQ